MAQEPQPGSIDLPGHYYLQGDVRFVNLDAVPNTGKYQIRFSQGPATIMDVLVSGETLGHLARALVPWVDQK